MDAIGGDMNGAGASMRDEPTQSNPCGASNDAACKGFPATNLVSGRFLGTDARATSR